MVFILLISLPVRQVNHLTKNVPDVFQFRCRFASPCTHVSWLSHMHRALLLSILFTAEAAINWRFIENCLWWRITCTHFFVLLSILYSLLQFLDPLIVLKLSLCFMVRIFLATLSTRAFSSNRAVTQTSGSCKQGYFKDLCLNYNYQSQTTNKVLCAFT